MSESKAVGPNWKSPLHVWLKSEYLDNRNFSRFGAQPAAFEEPSWPLGLRVKDDRSGDITIDTALDVIDTGFDHDVSCAWQLPLRYSRLNLGVKGGGVSRRDDLNWLIRGVGRWHLDEHRYHQILQLFKDNDRDTENGNTVRTGYALTPFCIITQRWTEDAAGNSHAILRFCDIALFYTFETFIQECLALEAYRNGVDPATIASSYEHLYCNSRPRPELIPTRPDEFKLSNVARSRIDWRSVLDLKNGDNETTLAQSIRRNLFKARRQCHLMAAIAAACIGIPAFESSKRASAIVKTAKVPFAFSSLTSHWLRHASGGFSYALECEGLLTALAEKYGNTVSVNYRGVPEPPPWLATTGVEEVVAQEIPPILLSRGESEGYGRYRWAIFDTSLDDQSLREWQSKLENLAASRG
jgi:hypothetical protein